MKNLWVLTVVVASVASVAALVPPDWPTWPRRELKVSDVPCIKGRLKKVLATLQGNYTVDKIVKLVTRHSSRQVSHITRIEVDYINGLGQKCSAGWFDIRESLTRQPLEVDHKCQQLSTPTMVGRADTKQRQKTPIWEMWPLMVHAKSDFPAALHRLRVVLATLNGDESAVEVVKLTSRHSPPMHNPLVKYDVVYKNALGDTCKASWFDPKLTLTPRMVKNKCNGAGISHAARNQLGKQLAKEPWDNWLMKDHGHSDFPRILPRLNAVLKTLKGRHTAIGVETLITRSSPIAHNRQIKFDVTYTNESHKRCKASWVDASSITTEPQHLKNKCEGDRGFSSRSMELPAWTAWPQRDYTIGDFPSVLPRLTTVLATLKGNHQVVKILKMTTRHSTASHNPQTRFDVEYQNGRGEKCFVSWFDVPTVTEKPLEASNRCGNEVAPKENPDEDCW